MTADIAYIDPGLAAWQVVTRAEGMITREQMRSALHYAATKTVIDENWLCPTRRNLIRYGAVSLRFVHEFDERWEQLLNAVRSQHGPRIMAALDEMVVPKAGARS